MRAVLRSDDQPLSELCKAILAESNTEADHPVFIREASTPLDTVDVPILDRLPEPNRHTFLIDRTDLDKAGSDFLGTLVTDIQKEALGRSQNSLRRLKRLTSEMIHLAMGWRAPRVPNLRGQCAGARGAGNPRDLVTGPREATPRQFRTDTLISNSPFRSGEGRASVDEFTGKTRKFTCKTGRIAVRGYRQVWERRWVNGMEGASSGAHADRRGKI